MKSSVGSVYEEALQDVNGHQLCGWLRGKGDRRMEPTSAPRHTLAGQVGTLVVNPV